MRVPGALEVSPETMIALLADRHAPEVTSGSPHVTARTLEAGAVRYHVFVNNFTDQYWGMPFHYDSPARNAAAVALVRDESVVTTVHFAGENRWLFDVETGEQVGTTDQPVPLALEPSWGRVWAALPCPCAELAVEVPEDIRQGDILRITLEMRDGTGACLPGAFSARVTLTAPCGRMSGASGFVGLADGRAEIAFSIGLNAEMGAWILVVEGGFPRAVQAQAFTVGEAEAPVALMR
ncbi:MAG: hypothetical protein BWY76_01223 [bacterium ADurb.Bin429]|nr:MAG: hypothetical protein BWY76_01223 [bacterium ADurb.Bin429]